LALGVFEDLTGDRTRAQELEGVDDGDLEHVNLMVGLYAQPLPRDSGFSDTAFRLIILMASRRLKSDRFFTIDYRPEIYMPAGFESVKRNTRVSVLLRHFPSLGLALAGIKNAFIPWNKVGHEISAAVSGMT
jgi:hypothetical protein